MKYEVSGKLPEKLFLLLKEMQLGDIFKPVRKLTCRPSDLKGSLLAHMQEIWNGMGSWMMLLRKLINTAVTLPLGFELYENIISLSSSHSGLMCSQWMQLLYAVCPGPVLRMRNDQGLCPCSCDPCCFTREKLLYFSVCSISSLSNLVWIPKGKGPRAARGQTPARCTQRVRPSPNAVALPG